MTLPHDHHAGDPWPSEPKPLGSILGDQKDPISLPEDKLREGRKFVFGGEVAKTLNQEIMPAQIPGHDEMRYRLLHVASHFARAGSVFADLGTSQGRMIRDVVGSFASQSDSERYDNIRFVGVDSEEDMIAVARSNLEEWEKELGRPFQLELMQHDLRSGLPQEVAGCSVITMIYCLQFVSMEYRQGLMQQIYNALLPGGALILAEKVLATNKQLDDLFTDLYYDEKARNGMSQSAIAKKRESLEGYLVPMTHRGNVELLESVGFHQSKMDVVWKNLQFEAIVATK